MKCLVTNCTYKYKEGAKSLTKLFSFPRNIDKRRQWFKLCGLRNKSIEEFTDNQLRVCSLHFKPDAYTQLAKLGFLSAKKRGLREDAIPELNLPITEENQQLNDIRANINLNIDIGQSFAPSPSTLSCSDDLNSDSKKKSLKKIALPTQNLPKESASHGKDQAQFIASSTEGNIQKAKFSKRKAITSLDTDDSSLEKKMKHVPMILKKKKSVINTSTSANLILNIPEEESINNFIEGEENENPVALEHEVCLNEEEQFDIPFVGIKEERGDTIGNEDCLSEGNHIDKFLLAIKQEYDETIDIKTEPEYVDFVNDLNLDNDHEYLVDLQNNIKIENEIKMEKVEEV